MKSYAKINLTLEILKKRDDSYHDITSIFHLIDLYDELEFEITESGHISIECSDDTIPNNERNLCSRAFNALKPYMDRSFGVDLTIKKNIPVKGGLGGGSSNAASTLLFLKEHLVSPLLFDELIEIGASIGADVPFFMHKENVMKVSGIGENCSPLQNKDALPLLLLFPKEGSDTKEAYASLRLNELNLIGEKTTMMSQSIISGFIKDGMRYLHNDFEKTVFERVPKLEVAKNYLKETNPLGAVMSGSGSTLFGVYETDEKRNMAFVKLEKKYNLLKSSLLV